MNPDLFLAILSMDSYNRGYGQGIKGLSETGKIGNATLAPASSIQQTDWGWEAAGFYAIAYEWNGQKIIAYRGTDEDLWLDIKTGYTTGAGRPITPA